MFFSVRKEIRCQDALLSQAQLYSSISFKLQREIVRCSFDFSHKFTSTDNHRIDFEPRNENVTVESEKLIDSASPICHLKYSRCELLVNKALQFDEDKYFFHLELQLLLSELFNISIFFNDFSIFKLRILEKVIIRLCRFDEVAFWSNQQILSNDPQKNRSICSSLNKYERV